MQRKQVDLNSSSIAIDQQLPICRICFESSQPIITLPCSCLSDNSHIHWGCLKRVQRFKNSKECDICKSKFILEEIYADDKRKMSCSCDCVCYKTEFYSFVKLVVVLLLNVGGCMVALTPFYIKMELLYTYLCIGVGSLLVYFSFQIKSSNPDSVKQFLKKCICKFCCCKYIRTSRTYVISCLWCLQFRTWISQKITSVRLQCNKKQIVVLI